MDGSYSLRHYFRRLLYFTSLIGAIPFYIIYRVLGIFVGTQRSFPGVSQLLSLFPGSVGVILRRGFYCMVLKSCSSASIIEFGTFFPTRDVVIGKNVFIGANCILTSCVIEEDVLIGSGVHLVNKGIHSFDSLDKPIRLQSGGRQIIHVGKDSWIGSKAIVMANVGEHCVVAAGSVVTKHVADKSIVVGNPARVIRKR